MSTSGGKFLDEMRYYEAIRRAVEAAVEGEQWRLDEAEEIMPEFELEDGTVIKPTQKLLTSTGGLANIGAKIPLGRKELREVHKELRRLQALLNIGYPMERWVKELEKVKVKYSFLQFAARREPPIARIMDEAPYEAQQEEFERKSESRLRRFGSWAKRKWTGDEDE